MGAGMSPSLSLEWNVQVVQKKKDHMKSLEAVEEKAFVQLTQVLPAVV